LLSKKNKKIKLKEFLKANYPELTSRVIKRALEQGACKINGKIERFATRRIDPSVDKIDYKDIRPQAKEKLEIQAERIIFEDEYILVYNKPGGYAALATERKDQIHLHGELEKFISSRDQVKKSSHRLYPVHRIDKNTSGLILFAKSKKVCKAFSDMFKNKSISKEYEAIVDGRPEQSSGRIENYMRLAKSGKGWQRWQCFSKQDVIKKFKTSISKRTNVDPNFNLEQYCSIKKFKIAITDYKVIEEYPEKNLSRIRLRPKTGRTHQLRVHMASLGCPILGDVFYADNFKSKHHATRHLLHASSLHFIHPFTGAELKLSAPITKDMQIGR